MNVDERIQYYLQQRKDNHLFRNLKTTNNLIDFSSNDYLGFSRAAFIKQAVYNDYKNYLHLKSGATGSRLLNGNSVLYEEVEVLLTETHHAEAALLFNSGFDANVGLISTVIRPEDTIFYDELVHASIHQGMKLSGAKLIAFKHNDTQNLEDLLIQTNFDIGFIITESVFSMEGDKADLVKIADLATIYNAKLIIDEAHATGLFGSCGSGCCNVAKIEEKCFARVYTFGKAIGSHGAAVLGSQTLKSYLINFSKNFIYSTALDTHSLLSVKHSYFYLQNNINQYFKLEKLNKYFIDVISSHTKAFSVCGDGPIFGIIIGDNKKCTDLSTYLQNNGFDVRAILSPTVPKSTERLRVILHSYNTTKEIDDLIRLILDYQ
jgi:8-amino-7-oxononanoate synthase